MAIAGAALSGRARGAAPKAPIRSHNPRTGYRVLGRTGLRREEAVHGGKHVDPRAHAILKQVLGEERITAVIPGVSHPEHLEANVKASSERSKPASGEEQAWLREYGGLLLANLPPAYRWLLRWRCA